MSTLEIHVGVDLAHEARAIKDALRRHEAGEAVHEAHITFESWEGLTQVLTSKRLEILRHLHRNPSSIPSFYTSVYLESASTGGIHVRLPPSFPKNCWHFRVAIT
jgi:hypothetical protein